MTGYGLAVDVPAIEQYAAPHNINPQPFLRARSAHDILQKLIRVAAE